MRLKKGENCFLLYLLNVAISASSVPVVGCENHSNLDLPLECLLEIRAIFSMFLMSGTVECFLSLVVSGLNHALYTG